MTVQQLDLADYAARLREAGQRVAIAHSDTSYRAAYEAAIECLARRMQPFSSDDLREMAGDPPDGTSPNVAGALINAAQKKGLIRFFGFTRSGRVVGHSNRVATWLGAK